MGMYTEFFFRAELVKDPPKEVLDVLRYMTDGDLEVSPPHPDHPLFFTGRWDFMLGGSSAYHPATGAASLHNGNWGLYYELKAHSSFKNYDDEIGKFLDWIDPYIDPGQGFLGYSLYEEDKTPTLTLYYKTDGE